MNIKKETIDFLYVSYFGVLPETIKSKGNAELMWKCARRAYRDLNRTLRFAGKNDKEKETFSNEICKVIAAEMDNKILTADADQFDTYHANICEQIMELAQKIGTFQKDFHFKYGQAQKWLNMTIKYMLLLGRWDDNLAPIREKLHIPVDNYILKAVWHEDCPEDEKSGRLKNVDDLEKLTINIPFKEGRDKRSRKNKFSSDYIVAWSQWEKDQYIRFIDDLRKSAVLKGRSPIDWEGIAWMDQVAQES